MTEEAPAPAREIEPAVQLKASIATRVNVAFHQNSVPAIAEIELANNTDQELQSVSLSVSAVPSFLKPKIFRIDRIPAHGTQRLNPVLVDLDPKFLLGLSEAVNGEITIKASNETELSTLASQCQILSPSEWTGLSTAPELIAAFVRPNDPSVDVILRNAAEKLRQSGRETALDGYQSRRKARAWEISESIWAALSDLRIVYALPLQSFERTGQKVRSPGVLLKSKLGTCLDLALLFAACVEQAGLNPVIGFCEGHAFCGVWLVQDQFLTGVVDEAQTLRKRMQLDELILVETTLLTNDMPVRFKAAVEKAKSLVSEEADKPFELIVDIGRARSRKIKPLALDTEAPAVTPSIAQTAPVTIEAPPEFVEEETVTQPQGEVVDRLERWKRKLLDLSLRNKLLNFKSGKSVSLICSDMGNLENKLAADEKLRVLPFPDLMAGNDPRNAELHFRKAGDDAARTYATEGLQRSEVYSLLAAEELDARLTELFRIARTSLEEGGANSLYLSLGFVSWTPQSKAQTCKAPLLLVPVALERRSLRSGFRLVRHDEDARINPTLLQMLRQDFNLRIPPFEGDLPHNNGGADIAQILRIARSHLKDVRGFEVVDDVVLSNFSFVKYLMWKDLVDRTELLKRNPVVRHLIDTPKESYGDVTDLPDERRLDDEVQPNSLFVPLPADSSQTAAIVAADRAKDFVLFGPPGTGKSQTIANMIVQLLAHQKTVLFVSQKTTALEVVRKRLQAIGLGSYCLEVHSAKAQKSSVLEQLKSAWDFRAAGAATEWDSTTRELSTIRNRLNSVVRALHKTHRNGLTAHRALGIVVANSDLFPGFTLPFANRDQHNDADLQHLRAVVRDLIIAINAVGEPAQHKLAAIARKNWSPSWQNQFLAASIGFQQAALELARHSGDTAALFKSTASGDPRWSLALLTFAAQALKPEAAIGSKLLEANIAALRDNFSSWKSIKFRAVDIETRLAGKYRDSVFELNLPALVQEWRDAANSVILVRNRKKRRVWDALSPFASHSMPPALEEEIGRLIELKMCRDESDRYAPMFAGFGAIWRGLASDMTELENHLLWLEATVQDAKAIAGPERSASYWLEALKQLCAERPIAGGTQPLRASLERFLRAYRSFTAARTELVQLAEAQDDRLGVPEDDMWLITSAKVAVVWSQSRNELQRWCKWRELSAEAEQVGLKPLIKALSTGLITSQQISEAFEIGYARWWIEQVIETEDALRTFIADHHNAAIERFAEIDEKVAELAQRVVTGLLSGNVPPRTAFGQDPEFGTLAREITKRARHMPLRQLFGQMPTALTKLAPCMMMSPLSIAQYLPADAKPFDVVIFDEASQIPVWDAIGAIARGEQTIVVGDPKQLPPTAFFERTDDGYDDASDLEDLESILDECLASNVPHKRLAWHYRSRHESLITFSNQRYYDGQLITFPSPTTEDRAVRYIHVPGGTYERGSGRVNRKEAGVVVREVIKRITSPEFLEAKSSIGVVTFNTEQQRLIENLLDQERRSRPELDRFFNREWHEPVFVKNLESVQGDERDVILFSVGYGPDASGRVSQNFGPLNKDGGPRRLNVAVTRARSELLVFATLHPDQIDLARTKAAGVRDFKHFLEFAERGVSALAAAAAPLDRDSDSPFEDAVRRALEERGWTVHPQVGVAGFRVDLGIVHPDTPGRYLAGVECDGATYHRLATARDRDLLRERVLRNLGWEIIRVWSTDWWVDAGRATEALHISLTEALKKDLESKVRTVAKESFGVPATAEINVAPEEPEIAEEFSNHDETKAELPSQNGRELERPPVYAERSRIGSASVVESEATYRPANLLAAGFSPDRDAFYDPAYRPALRRMIAHIVTVEGPIFDDLLIQRLARAHGFGRAAGRIREIVLRLVERRFPRSSEHSRRIYWPEGSDSSQFPLFRAGSLEDRDHPDIPLVELASLATRFLGEGAVPEEAALMIGRELGLTRLREATRTRFEEAAHLATKKDKGNMTP